MVLFQQLVKTHEEGFPNVDESGDQLDQDALVHEISMQQR